MKRPFYTTFAWAYDLLIQKPVKDHIDFIATQLSKRNIANNASLLDAGCGTGNYTLALSERGFRVTGLDISKGLIKEAKIKCEIRRMPVDFSVCDILAIPEELTFDAIVCRGVLNDLIETASRKTVFFSFAGALRKGGVLILDVREWQSTFIRKTQNPIFEKTVMTDKGCLTFHSATRLQPKTHSLLISETHTLQSVSDREVATFNFEMKCWTQEELLEYLDNAGFEEIQYFGDYDSSKPVGSTDRLIAVAVCGES